MVSRAQSLASWCLAFVLPVVGFAATSGDLDLAHAAKNQEKDTVRALLKQHVDPNVPQGDGSTALHWAAHWDDLDTATLLLGAGANANAANDLGVTPLYLACVNGSGGMVRALLAAGANPNLGAVTGVTPLMQAARSGSLEAVQALLARGADTNATENSAGQTALMWAASQQHPEVVRALVSHGADVRARSRASGVLVNINAGGRGLAAHGPAKVVQMGGFTPMLFAARVGCIDCAMALLAGGASANDIAPDGNSALVLAAHSGQGAFGVFLLDKDADPNAHGAGYTALHAAVLRGELDLVKALVAHGANLNAPIENGTPLRREGPDYALAESMVGGTAFLLAAKYADADIMRALAAGGADVKVAGKDGSTPLILAAGAEQRQGSNSAGGPAEEAHVADAVKVMLDLGADVNAANRSGNTAVYLAASRGYLSVVQLLADHGAKLDVKNNRGLTPLAAAQSTRRRSGDAGQQSRFKSTADLLRKLGATE